MIGFEADAWNPTETYLSERLGPSEFLRHLVKSTDPKYAHEYREGSDRLYLQECGRRFGPQGFENLTDAIALSGKSVDDVLGVLPDTVPFITALAGVGGFVDRRKPQATVETYALGHWEQMVIAKALAYVDNPTDPGRLTQSERDGLKGLLHLFASHGTVTVTRTNQED